MIGVGVAGAGVEQDAQTVTIGCALMSLRLNTLIYFRFRIITGHARDLLPDRLGRE
jgi:hypothetical protein